MVRLLPLLCSNSNEASPQTDEAC